MPELPEVETIVNDLRPQLVGRQIVRVETDCPRYFRPPTSFREFERCVRGRTIGDVSRRAKRILIGLDGDLLIVIHQKISGRLLIGTWRRRRRRSGPGHSSLWQPEPPGAGRFVHLLFHLDDGRQLALSDLRKFATVLYGRHADVMALPEMKALGPEPLGPGFTCASFKRRIARRTGAIKPLLMNPAFVAGIGNIYSDEILYVAGLHPLSRVDRLDERQVTRLYRSLRSVLRRAVLLRGTGVDAPPLPAARAKGYDRVRLVYHRATCPRGHPLARITVGGRSAHFCPIEQKLV
jgi:formamidopyrimidine-DNA glycosylase